MNDVERRRQESWRHQEKEDEKELGMRPSREEGDKWQPTDEPIRPTCRSKRKTNNLLRYLIFVIRMAKLAFSAHVHIYIYC